MNAFVAMRHAFLSNAGILQRPQQAPSVRDSSGQLRDSIRMVSRLITQAKSELLIIDQYADVTLLDILSEKVPG